MNYILEWIKQNKTVSYVVAATLAVIVFNLVFGYTYVKSVEERISKEKDSYYAEVMEKRELETKNFIEQTAKLYEEELLKTKKTIEELNTKIIKITSEKSVKTDTKIVEKEKIIKPDGTVIEKETTKDIKEEINSITNKIQEEANKRVAEELLESKNTYESIIKTKEEQHTKEITQLEESFKQEKETLLKEISKETIPVDRVLLTGGMNWDKSFNSSIHIRVIGNFYVGANTDFSKDGFQNVGLNVGIRF